MGILTTDKHNLTTNSDTIVAQATPPGRGGVGIIRISGPDVPRIGQALLSRELRPRYADYGPFHDAHGNVLDEGIALFFPQPNSFTGEDVLELQGHGGQVILDLLVREITALGARIAQPGEFSERAFLNNKLDLTQAEAIADLIDSSSEQAARNAVNTLQGGFSRRITQLVDALTNLRVYVEAAIDFPEEEIDFLADRHVSSELKRLQDQLSQVLGEAQQGATLREGMTVVMAGLPNAGKSSLLNALSGKDSAIVTDIPGTTRDVLREHIHIDGLPLHVIDTAGLRESGDQIEQEGIRRAWQEIKKADRILLVVDSSQSLGFHPHEIWPDFVEHLDSLASVSLIQNKIDLAGLEPGVHPPGSLGTEQRCPVVNISAKLGQGITDLQQHLMQCVGYRGSTEGTFSARRRHIDALIRAQQQINNGEAQLREMGAGELLAEDLRQAQQCLAEITGQFTSDDLLGQIFSSFCIGK